MNKTLIVAFEGLGPYWPLEAHYIEELLLPNLKKAKQADVQVFSWTEKPTIVAGAGQRLIVLGHSFGGAAVAQAGYKADLIVTIDPRVTGISPFRVQSNNADRWVNYYQRDLLWLPGCELFADSNLRGVPIQNMEVAGVQHQDMPGYQPIIDLVDQYIL